MLVSDIRILYAGEETSECDVIVLSLCTSHLLAGATIQSTDSYLWVGGQLTKKKTCIITGCTKPELIKRISELLSGFDANIVSICTNETNNDKFLKWFRSHL